MFSSLCFGKWVSILWYVRRGGEGRAVCSSGLLRTCRSFTFFYKLSQERKREGDLKAGKEEGGS